MPDYFPHDFTAHDDPKLKKLLFLGGYKMVGLYWTMLEYIGSTEVRGWPDDQLNTLARSLQVKYNTLSTAVEQLLNVGLMRHEGGYYYSSGLLSRMIELDSKRDERKEIATNAAKARWNRRNGDAQAFPEAMLEHSESDAGKMPTNLKENILPKLPKPEADEFTKIVETLNSGRDPDKPNNVNSFERGKLRLFFDGYGSDRLREAVEGCLHVGWRGTAAQIEDWLKGNRPQPKGQTFNGQGGGGVVPMFRGKGK